ncbi:MAG: FAD-dependent oxidoreductase, partial [Candidatus Latescibacterota bacterium]
MGCGAGTPSRRRTAVAVREFDLAIVGAGPAGATCALYAARAGLRVALLDRECFPRDKVCG